MTGKLMSLLTVTLNEKASCSWRQKLTFSVEVVYECQESGH